MEKITVKWLGHACFKVTCGAYSVVLDPFAPGSVPGLKDIRERANLVLCSHGHHDHNAVECVELLPEVECPFTITFLDTFHDDVGGAKRGPNRITVLEAGGQRVVHMGDLGCMLTPEQISALSGADAVLIPVGGFFTIDAAGAKAVLDAIQPKVAVPMHYRRGDTGLAPIGTLEDFLALCPAAAVLPGDTFTVGETPEGVIVPTYSM